MFIIKIYFYTKWLPHVLLCRMNNYFFPFWFYFKFMPQWQHTWKPCCIQLIFLLLLLVCIWEARFALPTSCVCVCVFFFFSAFCIIHETWTVHLCMCVWESRLRFPRPAFAFFFFFLVPLVLFMEHEQCIYACVFGKHVLRFPRPAFEFSFSFFSASSTCIYACEQCNAHEQ